MAWNRIGYIAALSLALIFAACGGDSENSSSPSQYSFDSDMVVESLDALPICTTALEGATAYVKNIRVVYICRNDIWMVDAPYSSSDEMYKELGSSSSENTISSSSFVVSITSSDYLPLSSFTVRSSSSSIPFEVQSSDSNESSSREKEKMDFGDVKSVEDYLNPQVAYEEMVDARDGQKYKTIKIGRQTWMAQNLNFEYNNASAKSYCYNNDDQKCLLYGRLYSWSAAMDSAAVYSDGGKGCGCRSVCSRGRSFIQGICPPNWHLPTEDEWLELFEYVGGQENAGKALKAAKAWSGSDYLDEFGLAVLPAGYMWDSNKFQNSGVTYFWSSTPKSDCGVKFYFISTAEWAYWGSNEWASSVRCVKND